LIHFYKSQRVKVAVLVRASVRSLLAPSFSRMMTLNVTEDDCSCSGQFRSIFTTSNLETDSENNRPDLAGVGGEGGVMVQAVNHATGQNSWKMMPADYDYNQELARAAFADMLHDSERNRLYYRGLEAAIKQKRSAGQEVHVLDIGTGTGLLSMMAVRLGADSVVACEEFRPMAECAERVMKENGYWDRIKLVRKRSTELTVGPGKDMERRANILVTEVFDTELIGEGAISTYNHAATHLLTSDRLVVPGVARVWAQVVTSRKCREWSRPLSLDLQQGDSLQSAQTTTGHSSLALHDLQLSQLDEELWQPVTRPEVVFSLDLACRQGDLPTTERTVSELVSERSGQCDAVMMWWDCWTDPDNTILLSCAPAWASHHPPASLPWRDHWMQAVYYPCSQTQVRQGDTVELVACHDEYSLWFDVVTTPTNLTEDVETPSICLQEHLVLSKSWCRHPLPDRLGHKHPLTTISGIV